MSWFYGPVAALLSTPLFLLAAWLHQSPLPMGQNPNSQEPVFCTMEAKLCPDGSYVGRTGPACEFTPCPGATSTESEELLQLKSLAPISGSIGDTVTISGTGLTGDNTIHFGGGVVMHVAAKPARYNCPMIPAGSSASCGHGGETLTFAVPNSLTPACFYSEPRCYVATQRVTPGTYAVSVTNEHGTSNELQFTVVSASSTTSAPVLYSITPSEGAIGTSITIDGFGFTSDNTIHFDGGVISHVSSSGGVAIMCILNATNCHPGVHQRITFTVPNAIGPACPGGQVCPMYVRLVTPGSYAVSIENANGMSNSMNFTVTDAAGGGVHNAGPISITGIDSPSSLPFGTAGTWTIHASVPNGAQLHYSVNWGDDASADASIVASTKPVQTSATFSHTYQRTGSFSPVFTVSDDSGHTATVSATVEVTPWY